MVIIMNSEGPFHKITVLWVASTCLEHLNITLHAKINVNISEFLLEDQQIF